MDFDFFLQLFLSLPIFSPLCRSSQCRLNTSIASQEVPAAARTVTFTTNSPGRITASRHLLKMAARTLPLAEVTTVPLAQT